MSCLSYSQVYCKNKIKLRRLDFYKARLKNEN